ARLDAVVLALVDELLFPAFALELLLEREEERDEVITPLDLIGVPRARRAPGSAALVVFLFLEEDLLERLLRELVGFLVLPGADERFRLPEHGATVARSLLERAVEIVERFRHAALDHEDLGEERVSLEEIGRQLDRALKRRKRFRRVSKLVVGRAEIEVSDRRPACLGVPSRRLELADRALEELVPFPLRTKRVAVLIERGLELAASGVGKVARDRQMLARVDGGRGLSGLRRLFGRILLRCSDPPLREGGGDGQKESEE